MTDAEWDAWQSSWRGATGPLPDVRARARKEARSQRLAGAAFFILVAATLPAAIPAFRDPSPAVHAIGWTILAFFAAMSLGYLWVRRGIGASRAGNPRQAIAFLERRLRFERAFAHLVRWCYAGLFLAFVIVFPRVVERHEAPRLELAVSFAWMLAVLAVTFSAPWWVARRNRSHHEEIDRWRRWIDEQQL